MRAILILFCFLSSIYSDAQVQGCTDPLSANYNPNATVNDGSCTYSSATVTPESAVVLADIVDESSGLIVWNEGLYTQNDDSDNHLYRVSPENGEITQTLTVAGATNQDWEEISQDEEYVYIGDFGNNVSGNRTNLHITKTAKDGLLAGNPVIVTINFTYADQTSLAATGNNNTDYDCEAMIVGNDYIYLFTKQWNSKKTSVYRLPKTPGNYVAELLTTYNVNGLITGATWLENQKIVALCGYNTLLSPFIYLLYDYDGDNFFSGNKRKVSLSESFTQIEGIATTNGTDYYLSSEHFHQSVFNTPQQLFTLNLGEYLGGYLASHPAADTTNDILLYPNPADHTVRIVVKPKYIGRQFTITTTSGQTVLTGTFTAEENVVDISALAAGLYLVSVTKFKNTLKLIVE